MAEKMRSGGCLQDPDECSCECHQNEDMMHAMACCHQCPYCYKNIATYLYDEHLLKCSKENGN